MDVNETKFKNNLLKLKESKFKEIVLRTCKKLGIKIIPSINFWEDYCPYNQGERAHYHPHTNTICISKLELKNMSLEDIEETATHEVTHILHPNHDDDFHGAHGNAKALIWRPPNAGVVIVTEDENKNIKIRSKRIPKNICWYHSCKIKKELKKCEYCDKIYCDEHLKPKIPRMIKDYDDYQNYELNDLNGHPCLAYHNHLLKIEEENKEIYQKALGKLLKTKNYEYQNVIHKKPFLKDNDNKNLGKKSLIRKIIEFFKGE